MITDVDGNELKIGDVCEIVCDCNPQALKGTEAMIVRLDAWPLTSPEYNCQVACIDDEVRIAKSRTELRKKRDRQGLGKLKWSDVAVWKPRGVKA